MDDADQLPEMPRESWPESLARIAEDAFASLVPGLGPAFVGAKRRAVPSPYEVRAREWLNDLVAFLRAALPSDTVTRLTDDARFHTILIEAAAAAARTHQDEKREALRNAVVNSALLVDPAEDIELFFLQAVQELTPTHLAALRVLAKPNDVEWAPAYQPGGPGGGRPPWIFLQAALADDVPDEFARAVYDDLVRRRFVNPNQTLADRGGDGRWHPMGTEFGESFIRYITDPSAVAE